MPTDALLIEHFKKPSDAAAPYGYYALLFDEDGNALLNTPEPLQLDAFVLASATTFAHALAADAQQPWRFWAELPCEDMNLPNNPYGCHYTIHIFARDAAGIVNPAVDIKIDSKLLTWLQREVHARLDPAQEQIMAVLTGHAVFTGVLIEDTNEIDGMWGKFLYQMPAVIITALMPTIEEILAATAGIGGPRYQVKVGFTYDDAIQRLACCAFLEEDGVLFTDVASVAITVRNSDDELVASVSGLIVSTDGQFNVSVEDIELVPDEVYFVKATIITAEGEPRTFVSGSNLLTWD